MTLSTFRHVAIPALFLSALSTGLPHTALAQDSGEVTMAAQVETPAADAVKTASGLAYVIQAPGRGTVHPADTDLVKIVTRFWARDSIESKPSALSSPATPMQVNTITLQGLREALGLMTVGQRMRIWLPENLAFAGKNEKFKGPLMVDVMLLDIISPPATPPDVAAPPADAEKSKSGLAWKILKAGTGTQHPKGNSTVTVHYTGWMPDGTIFDSSVLKGQPATLPLGQVIKGWSEGVQLMVVGEKRRLWVPGRLAYDGVDGDVPRGPLVFDVELIAIEGK